MKIEPSRIEEIKTAVKDSTEEALAQAASFQMLGNDDDGEEFRNMIICGVLRSAVVKYHREILPWSDYIAETRRLRFGGVDFAILTNAPIWEHDVLELAFVPPIDNLRVESEFGLELPLEGQHRYQVLRLFPPRLDIMFEFHQDLVRDIAQQVLQADLEWSSNS